MSTITAYPTYVKFFSTAEKLVDRRAAVHHRRRQATRRDALAYYRAVVTLLRHSRAPVRAGHGDRRAAQGDFVVHSLRRGGERRDVRARAVVVATGYFGSPNRLDVPGEDAAST